MEVFEVENTAAAQQEQKRGEPRKTSESNVLTSLKADCSNNDSDAYLVEGFPFSDGSDIDMPSSPSFAKKPRRLSVNIKRSASQPPMAEKYVDTDFATSSYPPSASSLNSKQNRGGCNEIMSNDNYPSTRIVINRKVNDNVSAHEPIDANAGLKVVKQSSRICAELTRGDRNQRVEDLTHSPGDVSSQKRKEGYRDVIDVDGVCMSVDQSNQQRKKIKDSSANSPGEKDFEISYSKKLADLEKDLDVNLNQNMSRRQTGRNDKEKRYRQLLKFAKNDAEVEKILIARVGRCEKDAAWHENRRLEANRDLRKHRNTLMKKVAPNTRNHRERMFQFLDIDDEHFGAINNNGIDPNSVTDQRRQSARRSMFACMPGFQPTLTQMNLCPKINTEAAHCNVDSFVAPLKVIQVQKLVDNKDKNMVTDEAEQDPICLDLQSSDKDACKFDELTSELQNEFRIARERGHKHSGFWEATKGQLVIEEIDQIVSNAVSHMESDGISELLHLFDAPPPPLEAQTSTERGHEESSSCDASMLQSQLSEQGVSLVEEIQSSVIADLDRLAAIESACPNWKDHVKYANLRIDACGIRDARDKVRESLSHLKLIRKRVLEAWSRQQCVLELYETTLERALSRFDNAEDSSVSETDSNELVIEITDDDDMSKHDFTTAQPISVNKTKISETDLHDEDKLPLHQLSVSRKHGKTIDSSIVNASSSSAHQMGEVREQCSSSSQCSRRPSDLALYQQITAALSASSLRVPILQRKTIDFDQFVQVLRPCGFKVTKKLLLEYLDSQGIPFATGWRQKKRGSDSQVDGSDCNSEID